MLYPLSYGGDGDQHTARGGRLRTAAAGCSGAGRPGRGHYIDRMAVYIDPPLWPAHGTRFSHLVSDASLAELHELAGGIGLSPRAFDEDHYDIAQAHYDEAVAAGAIAVDGRELVRRLVGSGLRIPAARRAQRAESALRSRWQSRIGGGAASREIRDELLVRWAEPHRAYHDPTHLLAVLQGLDLLCEQAPPLELLLAAWFHDAVHEGLAGSDEEASAALAERLLPGAGFTPGTVAEVARLVRLTIGHDPEPDDLRGQLLCDADLSVLGGAPQRYADYVARVGREYASVPRPDFVRGRLAVLEQLGSGGLYRTAEAERLWGERAAENLAVEIDDLRCESLVSAQPPAGVDVLSIVGVCFVHDGRLLTVRKRGTSMFMLVGGKIEPQESALEAAVREVGEEVGLALPATALSELGRFRSPAANEADTWIDTTVFVVEAETAARSEPVARAEIEQLRSLELQPAAVEQAAATLAPLLRHQVVPLLRRTDRRFWSAHRR